ncbi:MAG: FixH family protein [Gammaproteobacteria bacterium]
MNIRYRSVATGVAGIAATLLFATACSGDPPPAQTPQPTAGAATEALAISFRTLDAATQGDNKVEVVVKQADGNPVTDATVAVTFRMPAMPSMNMPEMHNAVSLAPQGDGRYLGTGQLEMNGSWNVAVTVLRGGTQIGSSRFTLQAK